MLYITQNTVKYTDDTKKYLQKQIFDFQAGKKLLHLDLDTSKP